MARPDPRRCRDRHGDVFRSRARSAKTARYLYTLPSVVDDIDFAVSHIIRGEDHVTNTAAQIEIFEALGAAVPLFAHHPLLVGAGGEALSKRLGSLSLKLLREDGIEPLAVDCYLAKTGTSDAVAPHAVAGRAGRRFRVREDRPRARPFRSGRTLQRSTPSCCTRCRSRPSQHVSMRWASAAARRSGRRRDPTSRGSPMRRSSGRWSPAPSRR